MKKLILFILGLAPSLVHADLLDQVHLESALEDRLVNIYHVYDDSGRIQVRLEVNGFDGNLPGTSLGKVENLSPDKIELMDIGRITVHVYSNLNVMPGPARAALIEAVPVKDKSKVVLNFQRQDLKRETIRPIEAKELSEIAQTTVQNLTHTVFWILGLAMLILGGFSYWLSHKRAKDLKVQLHQLIEAVAASDFRSPPLAVNVPRPVQEDRPEENPGEDNVFENWSTSSLRELMSDAYWCELDGYARWIWRGLSNSQRADLIHEVPFMKSYSEFFMDTEITPYRYHDHPYYMEPLNLYLTSQEDLVERTKQDIALWQVIGPMRKRTLPLTLDEKIAAMQAMPSNKKYEFSNDRSPARKLSVKPAWGELSPQDELALFNDPSVVPAEIRSHVRSLVWLSHKSPESIRKTLERFDARSLAAAWIGPEEALKRLESQLPEKKLKLLLSYRSRTSPSRQSEVYQQLVEEGLKSEAA